MNAATFISVNATDFDPYTRHYMFMTDLTDTTNMLPQLFRVIMKVAHSAAAFRQDRDSW